MTPPFSRSDQPLPLCRLVFLLGASGLSLVLTSVGVELLSAGRLNRAQGDQAQRKANLIAVAWAL